MSTKMASKDIGRRKSEFVAMTQFLFANEVDSLNLEFQNQAKNIPVGLPSSPAKSYVLTNKQTDTQTEITTLFI